MIADEHADHDADRIAQDDASGTSATTTNGSRGVGADKQESETAEEVLDLSEEFIVTETAMATPREHERQAPAEASGHGPASAQPVTPQTTDEQQAEAADTDRSAEAEPDSAGEDGSTGEEIAPSDVWSRDFQMPVAESGPASPFTAAYAHPESAWPAEEPFDVSELYNRARSLSRNGQPEESAEEPVTAAGSEGTSGVDDGGEAAAMDWAGQAPDSETAEGIELESLTTSGDGENMDEAADEVPAQNEAGSSRGNDWAEPAATPARFTAAEEIEAAFGMPQRGWDTQGVSEAASPSADFDVDAETVETEAEIGADVPVQEEAMDTSVGHDAHITDRDPHENRYDEAASEKAPGQPDLKPEPEGWPQPAPTPEAVPSSAVFPAEHNEQPSGKSLEDSVKELLRPMLQEWLDKNMPRLVEAAMREQMAGGQAGARGADLADDEHPPRATARYGTDE